MDATSRIPATTPPTAFPTDFDSAADCEAQEEPTKPLSALQVGALVVFVSLIASYVFGFGFFAEEEVPIRSPFSGRVYD